MLLPNTTFLIGRKGTGKSTVFQRAQHEIRKKQNSVSAYLDVKTVYESSDVDPAALQKLTGTTALSEAELRRFLLYKAFVAAVLDEIKKEIKKQVESSWTSRLKESLGLSNKKQFMASLDLVIEKGLHESMIDVTAIAGVTSKASEKYKTSQNLKESGEIKLSGSATSGGAIEVKGAVERGNKFDNESGSEESFSRTLIRLFDLKSVMINLASLLETIGIRKLYILSMISQSCLQMR